MIEDEQIANELTASMKKVRLSAFVRLCKGLFLDQRVYMIEGNQIANCKRSNQAQIGESYSEPFPCRCRSTKRRVIDVGAIGGGIIAIGDGADLRIFLGLRWTLP